MPAVGQTRAQRSSRCERLAATLFAVVMLGVTVLLIVAVIVPLLRPQYSWAYDVLLAFLGLVALLSGLYVLQIGWGAMRWTQRYRREKDTDWYARWVQDRDAGSPEVREWSRVQHFVVVTNYAEPVDMLRLLAYTLMSQRVPGFCRQQITLVLAMEEREGADATEKAQTLCAELGPYFRDVLATFHPKDLPGDIKGKASNYKWAVQQVEAYVRQNSGPAAGLCEEDCIIHVADADSLYDPNYFANVTYLFSVRADRHDLVWQPCMIPTCNFWQVAPPCRQVNVMIAAQEMMSAHNPLEFQIPFSTYGVSLLALQRISGTGNARDAQDGDVIAEDHHLFIKGFMATGASMRVQPIFLPCLNFSVGGQQTSLWRNLCDRYVQAKRHMFGISELFYFVSLLCQRSCCSDTGPALGCRGWIRALRLCGKLLKIHSIPYSGLWIPLGLTLVSLLKIQKSYCEEPKHELVCEQLLRNSTASLTSATESHGAWIFTFSTTFTFVGGVFVLLSFARMLYVVHHTLTNIGDPNGAFMQSFLWDAGPDALHLVPDGSGSPGEARRERQPLRRPIIVGDGFPWCGTVLQLAIEFLSLSLVTSLIFGSIPAVLGLLRFILKGHTMEYVTAPKAATGGDQVVPADVEVSELGGLGASDGQGSEASRGDALEARGLRLGSAGAALLPVGARDSD